MPVGYELDGHVATITIDRPDALSAIDLETWQAFAGATSRLEESLALEQRLFNLLAYTDDVR